MKSKSFMLMILSMGFGLIAAIGISQVMGRSKANAQPVVPMGPVLVAAEHLDMYTKLNEENVKLENWPENIIPGDAITSIEDIANNVTLARLSKGMPLVASAVVDEKQRSVIEIPEGFKVVAIKASGDSTIAGLLNAGDKVDIIGYFSKRGRNGQMQSTSKTFLKGIRVFSINGSMKARSDRSADASQASAIVSLLLNEKQSEDIYFAQQTGDIKLVMRGETETDDDEVEDLADLMDWDSASQVEEDPNDDQPVASEAFSPPRNNSVMVIWNGSTPEMYSFGENSIPTLENGQFLGSGENEARVVEEDLGDFDGSDEIDSNQEQD